MEKSGSVGKSNRSFRSQCWCIVFVFLVIWFGLLYFFSSSTVSVSKIGENIVGTNQTDLPDSGSIREVAREQESRGSDEENGGKMEKEETLGEPKSETEVKGKPFDLFRNTKVDAELISALEKELEPKVIRRNGRKETRSSKKEEEATKIRKPTKMKHEGKSVEKEKEEVAEKPAEKDSEEEVLEKVMEKEPEEVPERLMENPEESRRDRRIRKSARQRRRNRQKREAADESSANKLENLLENNGVVKENALNCSGKYIYIHKLPKKFNQDLLDNCRTLTDWFDMCYFTPNLGLGPRLPQNKDIYSDSGWFDTNQFFLEVIFHNRMKQYECLTNDPSKASAIFVPYYAGLDVGRYLWESDGFMRDYDALNLVKWLSVRLEWKKMWGRDHFLIAGRINWDFRRDPKNTSDWGNELLNLPESRNMSILTLESSPWNFNDFAIPYPTYFHPATDGDVFQWQNRMRRAKRRFLFSFAGAPRPHLSESIRNEIIDQCKAAKKKCKLLECINRHNSKCSKPIYVMKMFENSVFCLQPQGDSYTRRSVFDSILAGCIPVFFHPGTAYAQYIWHLPRDHAKYSVFISEKDVKSGRVNIENVLQRIPRQKRVAMREEVIKLIPNVVYADPASRLETLEDAFDLSVRGVIERVESVRRQMESGKIVNSDFGEEDSWKYFTYGTVEPHEWDPFFERKRFVKG